MKKAFCSSQLPRKSVELPVFDNAKRFLNLSKDRILEQHSFAKHIVTDGSAHIELRFNSYTLACMIDGDGQCALCLVFFDTDDAITAYLKLCTQKYAIKRCRWLYKSMIVDYHECPDNTVPSFFTIMEFDFNN